MSTTLVHKRDSDESLGRTFTSLFQVRLLTICLGVLVMSCTTVCQDMRKPGIVSQVESVFIVGNVVNQRSLILRDSVTLTRAIAIAGGVNKRSELVKVGILRGLAKKQTPIIFDLKAIIEHRIQDPLLQPGDIVEVSDEHGQLFLPYLFRPTPPIWDPPLKPRKELTC